MTRKARRPMDRAIKKKGVEADPASRILPPASAVPGAAPYHLTTLPGGLRVATAEMPHMASVCVGLWAAVGSRHESAQLNGAAHFLEHLLFKGTKRRSARRISGEVEGLGGYLEAFTAEDHTCYYAKAEAGRLRQLADVLGDIYVHSRLPAGEVERERGVIKEEILMYQDQPAQVAEELLAAAVWPGASAGPSAGGEPGIARRPAPGRPAGLLARGLRGALDGPGRGGPGEPRGGAGAGRAAARRTAPGPGSPFSDVESACRRDGRAARGGAGAGQRAGPTRPGLPGGGTARPGALRPAGAQRAAGREDGQPPLPEPARAARPVLLRAERTDHLRRHGSPDDLGRSRSQAAQGRAGAHPPRGGPALCAARRRAGSCARRATTSLASTA